MLRQSAESTLSHVIITVFGRVTGGTDDNLTKIDAYDKKKASNSSTALRLETAGQTEFLKDGIAQLERKLLNRIFRPTITC